MTIHGLAGQTLLSDSVDSGWRLSLQGLAGEIVKRWDARGNRWSHHYDERLRLKRVQINDGADLEALTYGLGDADAGNNLRGQLLHKLDASGSLDYTSFNLSALPFEETRTLFDGASHTTQWRYGANGNALSQTDAARHQQLSRYDVAGQLQQVTLKINGDSAEKDILKQARYNAEGQKIEQTLGNGVVCNWIYDPANSRLNSIKAGVPGKPLRQNLQYAYDNVGNVLSLVDHTFNPVFFANQLIDGKRDFSYDSLYRLTSATGHDTSPPTDVPGRPLPSDPNNRLNYTQTYEYDTGGNLIKLVHARAVGGYTRRMFIDPNSNRGVRWNEGDPTPDFSKQFDTHGNQQALQPGQGLQWNILDELASVTLIERESELPDQESYRYSGGARVYKHHETQGSTTTHFQQVRYLPGLEIRTRDTGEELHVVSLPNIVGNFRCLHWLSGRPGEIVNDQLRYCLEDSQNSSLIELDRNAHLISHEHYYPFGGTASLAAGSELEVSYKTIRYSGKELDDTGLYYYGRRYYAPWLQRWISADPAGAVDGWNLYAMVGNNPLSFVDELGLNGRLNKNTSEETTRMIKGPTGLKVPVMNTPAQKKKAEAFFLENPHARYSKNFKSEVAVAHAGVLIPVSTPDDEIIVTGLVNIPLEKDVALTRAQHGVVEHRAPDDSLGRDNLVAGGIFSFQDPDRYVSYTNDQYTARMNDPAFPVNFYKGDEKQKVSLAGLEYEQVPLHPLIKNRIQGHIAESNALLPKSSGLPASHAEVQAASLSLYIQQQATGTTDPSVIEIVTQKLQGATAAVAFPACFNCTHLLLESYDNTASFGVLTGRTETRRSQWNSAVVEYR